MVCTETGSKMLRVQLPVVPRQWGGDVGSSPAPPCPRGSRQMAETGRETRDGAGDGSSCGENSSGVGSDGDEGAAPQPPPPVPNLQSPLGPPDWWGQWGQGHTRGRTCSPGGCGPRGQGQGRTGQGWSPAPCTLHGTTTAATAGDTSGTGDTHVTSRVAQMARRHVTDGCPPTSRRSCCARAIPVVPVLG